MPTAARALALLVALTGCGDPREERPSASADDPAETPSPTDDEPTEDGTDEADAAPRWWVTGMPTFSRHGEGYVRGHHVVAVTPRTERRRRPPASARDWRAMEVVLPEGVELATDRAYRVAGAEEAPAEDGLPPRLVVSEVVEEVPDQGLPPEVVPGQGVAGLRFEGIAVALASGLDPAPFEASEESIGFWVGDVGKFRIGAATTSGSSGGPGDVLNSLAIARSGGAEVGPCEEREVEEGVAYDCGGVHLESPDPDEPTRIRVWVTPAEP